MLVNVQLLRFVAALAVVLYHAAPLWSAPPPWVAACAAMGFSGVDVFFVISGFILWHTTRDRHGPRAAATFLTRRFVRIFTGYWPFFAIALVLWSWLAPHELAAKDWTGSLLLAPIPMDRRVIPVSWTLTYELYFYLLFALLLGFAPRHRTPVLCVLGVCVLAAMIVIVWDSGEQGLVQRVPRWLRPLASPYLLEFLAGALIARIHAAGWCRGAGLALAGGVALFALGGWLNVGGHALESGVQVARRVTVFGPAAGLLVYAAVSLDARGRRLWPPVSILLGGASYSLYLAHTLFIAVFSGIGLGRTLAAVGETSAILVWISVMVLYSVAHYRWLERPCYRAVCRWFGA